MNIFFAILFVILNILDVTTTNKIIAIGGKEVSPLPWLLMKFNLYLPVKTGATLALAIFMIISQDVITSSTLCGIISLFVVNNYYQLYKYDKETNLAD